MVTIEEVECLAACDGAPVVQVNTENYERLSTSEALELLESLRRDEVPPPTFAADGSVTEPSTAALHWRLAGLGDPPAGYDATAAAGASGGPGNPRGVPRWVGRGPGNPRGVPRWEPRRGAHGPRPPRPR